MWQKTHDFWWHAVLWKAFGFGPHATHVHMAVTSVATGLGASNELHHDGTADTRLVYEGCQALGAFFLTRLEENGD